jgi:fructokinase
MMLPFGGIEAGGTKWVCAVGSGPDDLHATETFATGAPEETLARAAAFFRRHGPVAALGIGSFGPVDLAPGSPTWGRVTTTPKPGWRNADVAGPLRQVLGVPVAFDSDVNAAALGEHVYGAARGLDTAAYVTVGTGIGAGVVANGALLHGLSHPEFGHLPVPHDRTRDPFDGVCPYHGDCLEGLASGEALRVRWGRPAPELDDPEVWELEAGYLAHGLAALVLVLSPQRIVVGGGVAQQPALLPLVRARLAEVVGGYVALPPLEEYVVPPALGDRAGVVGALELARRVSS